MARQATNNTLHKAKSSKSDEFYTLLEDIERELVFYKECFRGKTVYCNCDNPKESNFFKYFFKNFRTLGLTKLVASYYVPNTQNLFYESEPILPTCHVNHSMAMEILEVKNAYHC